MTRVTSTSSTDLTGYEFVPRSIATRSYGFDVAITETPHKNGLDIKIELQGIKLTRKQQRLLARSLSLWKYGLKSVEPSPIAQNLGFTEEYQSL